MGRYRINKERKNSRYYILLSVIFLVVVFKWGIPLFVRIIAGDGVKRQTEEVDVIPPQSPVLSALPEATNSSSIVVDGYTEPEASLEFLVNEKVLASGKSDQSGQFSMVVQLESGDNLIQVRAADAANNTSLSAAESVILDTKPLTITISSPKDGTEFFGKNNQVVEIRGEINKSESQVMINNSFVVVGRDGLFTHRFQIQNGNNQIDIMASDRAGNTDVMRINLVYTP